MNELETVVAIAEDAGRELMLGWRRGGAVQKKGTIDLVTEWDLRSERLIVERLRAAFPDDAIVAEEGGGTAGSTTEARTWWIDPLDGTTNFAHGHPFFAVSIGLLRGADPLLGVVHAPALGVTWSAARGAGCTRNGEPCRVSTKTALVDALCATGFAYQTFTDPDDNVAETQSFLHRTHGFRRCGSAAIDCAMVADGTYDFYWEKNLKGWDLAAGTCLVLESGGKITAYDGSPCDPRRGELVASNGLLHEDVLAVLRHRPG
jgi:myo-inositol-1(or 4)-monophosphatase